MKYIVDKFGMIKTQKSKRGIVEIITPENKNYKVRAEGIDIIDSPTPDTLRIYAKSTAEEIQNPVIIGNLAGASDKLKEAIAHGM